MSKPTQQPHQQVPPPRPSFQNLSFEEKLQKIAQAGRPGSTPDRRTHIIAIAILVIWILGATFYFTDREIRESGTFESTMDIISTDKRVIEALGTPVRAGYWLSNKSNRKMMRIDFSVYGPNGTARATTQSVLRASGVPHIELIMVLPEGKPVITLVKDGKPA